MRMYLTVRHRNGMPLHNVGVLSDGTLVNPNGYPENLVREAVETADARYRRRALGRPALVALSKKDALRRDELIAVVEDVLGLTLALRERHRLAEALEQWLIKNDNTWT